MRVPSEIMVALRFARAEKSAPQKVEKYYKTVKEKNPDYSESKAWATAWSIYCEHVKPEDKSCKQDSYFPGKSAGYRSQMGVDSPATAAQTIAEELHHLFDRNYFQVRAQRGVGVEFARIEPEEYARRQITQGYYSVPPQNMRCVVLLVPGTVASSAWQDLSIKFGGTPDEIRDLKEAGLAFRKASGLTPEKAVDTVIKWFQKNATKLKGI